VVSSFAEVQDSGRGIAAEGLPHIFDRFYRGRAGAPVQGQGETGGGGAGPGLAIARRTIELHGCEIAVESTPGEGTRLWFKLPLA
jgi:signal transduction histidine kinase